MTPAMPCHSDSISFRPADDLLNLGCLGQPLRQDLKIFGEPSDHGLKLGNALVCLHAWRLVSQRFLPTGPGGGSAAAARFARAS